MRMFVFSWLRQVLGTGLFGCIFVERRLGGRLYVVKVNLQLAT
jgi:hypothetical protein